MEAHCLRCQPRAKSHRAPALSLPRMLPRVGDDLIDEDDESVIDFVLEYGSCDAVQERRSHAQ
jgi:hypothetical protein